jgi:putative methanogenesis marker protein 8
MEGKAKVREFLSEIEKELGELPKDLHVTRMCCALIAVSEGRIIKAEKPRLKYCPLRARDNLYKFKNFDLEEICNTVNLKMSRFGYFTKERELYREKIEVKYGVSEILMYALSKKGIDAAVTVCDGAGTVITSEPSLVQGIGARMTGVFYTSPIKELIQRIEERKGYVVFPETARIDQIAGLEKAIKLGFKRIAVTINGFAGEDLRRVREVEKRTNASITALIVCTTGITKERAEEIKRYADLTQGCASLYVREIVGRAARLQIATRLPVFALTQKGIDFVSNYSSEIFKEFIQEGKKYLISGYHKLMKNPRKIRMGNFYTYIGEVEDLPLRVEDEPTPLI